MVHSLTRAGVLPVQYIKLSKFAGIGHVGHGYMKKGTKKNVVIALYAVYYTAVDTLI